MLEMLEAVKLFLGELGAFIDDGAHASTFEGLRDVVATAIGQIPEMYIAAQFLYEMRVKSGGAMKGAYAEKSWIEGKWTIGQVLAGRSAWRPGAVKAPQPDDVGRFFTPSPARYAPRARFSENCGSAALKTSSRRNCCGRSCRVGRRSNPTTAASDWGHSGRTIKHRSTLREPRRYYRPTSPAVGRGDGLFRLMNRAPTHPENRP